MFGGMTVAKIAVSLPSEQVAALRAAVRDGQAASVSALVSEAVGDRLERESLASFVAFLDAEWGPPDQSILDEVKAALQAADEQAPWPG